ncbi:hypothetical protein R1sor_019854 [Riccia sorocarpa]|uniref:Proline-rich protein PRCC n=1 Tax=Riccia sorocarpa TaxID=122646 RepID=A0ABD3II23_9MARC
MDLLAGYGSDEEDDGPAVPSSAGGKSVFSLPPPKGSSAQSVSIIDTPVKERTDSVFATKAAQSSLPSDFFGATSAARPRAASSALPSGFFDERSHDRVSRGNSATLFSKLPAPGSSTRLSLASLPPPSKSTKKTVEFRPPVNLSALEDEDEEEEERRKKRAKASEMNKRELGANAGGLAALLPPPKNSLGSGLTLGGGGLGGGGRRTTLETASSVPKDVSSGAGNSRVVGSSEAQLRVENQYQYSAPAEQVPSAAHPGIPEGNYASEQFTSDVGYQNYGADSGYQNYTAGGGYQNGAQQQGYTNWEHSNTYGATSQPAATSVVPDPIAEVLQRERRKGKNEPPPQMIEVKQADLTGGKVREDQLRTTGIAFGPTYQPVSAGKDKPSKIHRRKHQIGALYFDMKSKEMELLDRRSKGNLTKAETQAKYGW